MRTLAEPIVEHIEYRDTAADHHAFVAAFALGRSILLAARGCRHVAITRGSADATEYRARIEWRSSADRDGFMASESSSALEKAMATFERRAHRLDTPLELGARDAAIDAVELRRAFGHYPTGVAVIAAIGPRGPAGMVVSSFTSVSLEPALVSFCAAHTSSTWPTIADAKRCCINVLASSQGELSKRLASRREDRFEGIAWTASPGGAPILEGVVGWLDCRMVETRTAGDHDLVLLEVLAHGARPELEPLLFHRSGYRRIAAT
jgi:flavin reductase (DIM6/NTAB) family NADH-FMN oxidoreductase RutF